MKKILVIINTEFISYGGLTSVIMNYYDNMDKTDLMIDFASSNALVDVELKKKLEKNNSNYYQLGLRRKHPLRYSVNLLKLLIKNKYDVVHVNGNSSIMVLEIFISNVCRVQKRIAHGHTSQSDFPLMHSFLRPFLNFFSTDKIAVSDTTGTWLYGNNFLVLNNAIDVEKYQFDSVRRNQIRKELKIEESNVIGHVGKLMKAKNHSFLIDVFYEFQKSDSTAILVLVGGGELERELKLKCETLGIQDKVLFLGMRNDIPTVLQSFDIFCFPSVYEGLGMALIEAQANGLACLASSNVPKETKVTDSIKYLSLDLPASIWAKELHNLLDYNRKLNSTESVVSISKSGYNIKLEAEKLKQIYNS